MAWFALHCPSIIQTGEEPPECVRMALLHRFEGCSWSQTYVAGVRKLLCHHDVYSPFRCFTYIRDTGYCEEFKDVGGRQTLLSRGVFEWPVSIWSSHLLYRSGDTCYLEPYVPSRFARQFGYDQLSWAIRISIWLSWGASLMEPVPGDSSPQAVPGRGCVRR